MGEGDIVTTMVVGVVTSVNSIISMLRTIMRYCCGIILDTFGVHDCWRVMIGYIRCLYMEDHDQ